MSDPNIPDRINYVVDHWADPCDAPFMIYVKTAWPALLEVLWLYYFVFDWKQLIAGWVRPARAMARRRSQKKRGGGAKRGRHPNWMRRVFGRIIGFDLSEFLGKKLNVFIDLENRKVSAGVVTLWIFEGVIERALYWYMIADLASLFLYRWTSNLYRTGYCLRSRYGVLLASGGPQSVSIVVDWNPLSANEIEKQRGPIAWNIVSGFVPAGPYIFTASCKLADDAPEGAIMRFAIFIDKFSTTVPFREMTVDPSKGDSRTAALSAEFSGGTGVRAAVQVNVAFATITDKTICISGGKRFN